MKIENPLLLKRIRSLADQKEAVSWNLYSYLEAVAIPRAMGSKSRSLSSIACTKFAPTRPVSTTTAAVREGLAPANQKDLDQNNV
jgi:hypothetical protein